ncbi:VOC family protein [Defluviimonas sp. SAOS-178_SWC]|uniref:VOC family protein n=1 Tax=Defluviimonas sp. SAOS-178_SWC TaxID=3121287 RepID=UPI003221E2EA
MAAFDHLAVSAATLEDGAAAIEDALGVAVGVGGVHPFMGTHNRLLGLGAGEYLEVIAVDPAAPPPPHPRWFRLDRFSGAPRLSNWIVRVDDLDAVLAMAPDGAGRAVDLERGPYRWRMGVPDDGCLPFDDAFPALIEWRGNLHPAAALPDVGCRLLRLEVAHPDAAALRAALPLSDPRLIVVPGEPALRATIATPHGERRLG